MFVLIDIKRLLSLGCCRRRGTYMNSMTEARQRAGFAILVHLNNTIADAAASAIASCM